MDERVAHNRNALDGAAPASGTDSVPGRWRLTALLIAFGTIIIIALHWPVAAAAVQVWYGSTSYNHCFLIPFITGYLLWERRDVFARHSPEPILLPLVAILGLSLVALVGNAMSILEIQQFALVGMIQMLVLALVGWRVFHAILFPLLYLFFLVPTGEFLVPRLQDFTAAFVVGGLDFLNIPYVWDGIFIGIPNQMFEVAEACAGLRFLIANVAFGCLFAYLMYRRWHKRVAFVALSFVVPIIANGFRALGIVLIAYASDGKLAAGVDHIVYGWGFFVAVMLAMMWLGLQFRDPEPQSAGPQPGGAAGRWTARAALFAAAGAVAFAASGSAYSHWLAYRHPPHAVVLPELAAGGDWQVSGGPGEVWQPTFAGADGELGQRYADRQGEVHLHVAYFSTQRYGAKIISAQNRIEGDGVWKRASTSGATLTVEGRPMTVGKQVLNNGNDRRVALYFYWVDRQFTGSTIGAKLLGARGLLLSGHPEAAVIVLAADSRGSEAEAEARIQALLRNLDLASYLSQAATR